MNKQSGTKSGLQKLFKGLIISSFLISFFSFSYVDDLFQVSKNLDIFAAVYKQLSINYVDEVNSSKIMETGIVAMLDELDPYTQYIPESEIEEYKLKYVSNQYGGIGATISIRGGKVIVAEPYEGFPAEKGGLRAGDELLKIGDFSLKGKNNQEVGYLLKGQKDTKVDLLIQRPGIPKPIEIQLLREEIKLGNVSYYGMLSNSVGYIKLDRFLENAAQDVEDALVDLKKTGLNALVLDLRDNGGGILQESVKIVNLFVEKGITVVIQKGRNREKPITYKTSAQAIEPDLPLIILVNGQSASASEIIAGSLQDLDRAVVIGQRSFGKGLVQQTFNLPYNSLVKVTVAKYYTPSGRCIQALDYNQRDTEGQVAKLADSLITEYKTKSGRSVYDGSGIFPDVFVSPEKNSLLTRTLISGFHIFDYATQYHQEKAKLASAKTFKLSDSDYEDFVKFLSKRTYSYQSASEKLLNDLRAEAKEENKFETFKPELEALNVKIAASKKNDLYLFKEEIKKVLESEIVSRYYYQKGRTDYSLPNDRELNEAIKVFTNKTILSAILKGEGGYRSIGKPGVRE
jgi:carboxyl-terminal processing protease